MLVDIYIKPGPNGNAWVLICIDRKEILEWWGESDMNNPKVYAFADRDEAMVFAHDMYAGYEIHNWTTDTSTGELTTWVS